MCLNWIGAPVNGVDPLVGTPDLCPVELTQNTLILSV